MLSFVDRFMLNGKVAYQLVGQSMLPLLNTQDKLWFRRYRFSQYRLNDLLLFKQAGLYVVHRLIYKTATYVITKGDNNPYSDGKIFPGQIIGKVIKIQKGQIKLSPRTLYLWQSGYYLQEILLLNQQFLTAGIKVCFLKGLPLHLYYEGNHPQRLYADCDLLIDPSFFPKAKQILHERGYQKLVKPISAFLAKWQRYQPEVMYVKKIHGLTISFDLHQELVFMMIQLGNLNNLYRTNWVRQLTDKALANRQDIKINHQSLSILKPNWLVLYLGLHLFHHNYQGAFRYQFLDKIIRHERKKTKFLWQELTTLINQYQLNHYLWPTFVLLRKYYHTPIPKQFLQLIRPKNPIVRFLAQRIVNRTNIFDEQSRIKAGIIRFTYLLIFSPQPYWRRLLVFLQPNVLLMSFWLIKRRLFK